MTTKFTVAICGGGIAGLCLAAELSKSDDIRVDVYEAADEIAELGGNVTLWQPAKEILEAMELMDDCEAASKALISAAKLSAESLLEFSIRHFDAPHEDFGRLPFDDAWTITRGDMIHIFRSRIRKRTIQTTKRLVKYTHVLGNSGPIGLEFADGMRATCDVLIGCDGIRSIVRAQMMKEEATVSGKMECMKCVGPRWTGTIIYRTIVPRSCLAIVNPNHRLLEGGQIYLGKNQHVIAQVASRSMFDIAISISHSSRKGSQWPYQSWSRTVDKRAFRRKISTYFAKWDEVRQIIDSVDRAVVESAVMDTEILPFYVKEQVALVGDAAHAAMPYIGASTTFAMEDAYLLASLLRSSYCTRESISRILETYERIREPYGRRMVIHSKQLLREFQYAGQGWNDPDQVTEAIHRIFNETLGPGSSSPLSDVKMALQCIQNF